MLRGRGLAAPAPLALPNLPAAPAPPPSPTDLYAHAKEIKTKADLNALSRALVKLTVETALNAKRSEHVG